jgi:hypothetical protein
LNAAITEIIIESEKVSFSINLEYQTILISDKTLSLLQTKNSETPKPRLFY